MNISICLHNIFFKHFNSVYIIQTKHKELE